MNLLRRSTRKHGVPAGLSLAWQSVWRLSPPNDHAKLIDSLPIIITRNAIGYFEHTHFDPAARSLFERYEIEPSREIETGTIWPRPKCFHLPLTRNSLLGLKRLFQSTSAQAICAHFHVYDQEGMLLEWFDAFAKSPLYLSVRVPEDSVAGFCHELSITYVKELGDDAQ